MKGKWIDSQVIPVAFLGETVGDLVVAEANRATVFEERPSGIKELMDYATKNYTDKGVNAQVIGVRNRDTHAVQYAVFVEPGFLREVGAEC